MNALISSESADLVAAVLLTDREWHSVRRANDGSGTLKICEGIGIVEWEDDTGERIKSHVDSIVAVRLRPEHGIRKQIDNEFETNTALPNA